MTLRPCLVIVVAVTLSLWSTGCSTSSSDGNPQPSSTTAASGSSIGASSAAVDRACGALGDLGTEVLALQRDSSAAERSKVRSAFRAFERAARSSGDAELRRQGSAALAGIVTYLGGGAGAQVAGREANAAVDLAGARCQALGAQVTLPTQPAN